MDKWKAKIEEEDKKIALEYRRELARGSARRSYLRSKRKDNKIAKILDGVDPLLADEFYRLKQELYNMRSLILGLRKRNRELRDVIISMGRISLEKRRSKKERV